MCFDEADLRRTCWLADGRSLDRLQVNAGRNWAPPSYGSACTVGTQSCQTSRFETSLTSFIRGLDSSTTNILLTLQQPLPLPPRRRNGRPVLPRPPKIRTTRQIHPQNQSIDPHPRPNLFLLRSSIENLPKRNPVVLLRFQQKPTARHSFLGFEQENAARGRIISFN